MTEAKALDAVIRVHDDWDNCCDFWRQSASDEAREAADRSSTWDTYRRGVIEAYAAIVRARAVVDALAARKPKAHPARHGKRCWWCSWMADAQSTLDALTGGDV